MLSGQVFLYVILFLRMISAIDENNITSNEDQQKSEFACTPREDWNIITLWSNAVEEVCLAKDYKTYNPPKDMTLNPMFADILHSLVMAINEQKRTMTIEISLRSVWQDERIRAFFFKA